MTEMIQVENLQKEFRILQRQNGILNQAKSFFSPKYRLIKAVDGINFYITRGEIVGYLGPNGAGKSTTIKMLTGILVPSGGKIIVNGYIPWKSRTEYVKKIGVVFGQRSTLWWDLPVMDSMELLKSIYRIPTQKYKKTLDEFIGLLDMDVFINSPARSLSLGQIMRANLCAAMLHEPELLFLDEPTIGLDVVAKEKIRQFIKSINIQQGTTVILTTHDVSDVEKLCQRVIIIDLGKKLFDGKLANLVQQFDDNRIVSVTFSEEYEDITVPGIVDFNRVGRRALYSFSPKVINPSELISYLLRKFKIDDIEINHTDLESIIRNIYENKLLVQNKTSQT